MKSNDWRHKNVAPYTPGNTKILYFFNCLLDGMHTKTSKGAITANAGIAPFSFIIKEKFDMLREALPEIVTGSVPGAKAKAILDRRNE